MRSKSHFEADDDLGRYEALLQTADAMVHHQNLPELFTQLAEQLHAVAHFEIANFALRDPATNTMRLHFWAGSFLTSMPREVPIDESASGWVWQNQLPLITSDLHTEPRFPKMAAVLKERGIRAYCTLPLTTARKSFGALGFGSSQVDAYGERDVRFLSRVAELVALAVENSLTRMALEEEKERLQMLLQVHRSLVSNLEMQQLFPTISDSIRKVMKHDFARLAVYEEPTKSMHLYPLDAAPARTVPSPSLTFPVGEAAFGVAFQRTEAKVWNLQSMADAEIDFVKQMMGQEIQSFCSVPLVSPKGWLGTLNLGSRQENAFASQNMGLMEQVATAIAIALDNARAYREIAELKDKLASEKLYLEDEIRTELNFEEIIGESPALKQVLGQVKTVAPSHATVLILGETGTGKELIARAIHRMSSCKDASFIKMNCAAIPTGLLESELFGHEKGAFTGAINQKIGRLELADKGTLFLDEVGDIPLELQPKLLRVLQDQEFERLGSNRTIKVNIRLIAATNRNLAKSVLDHEFRSDLFYRLNVFPIQMPTLRERRQDITLLARHFVQRFARKMDKDIETIPTETMTALANWEWPGNIRELENFIERSVILTDGPVLRAPLAELRPVYEGPPLSGSLRDVERQHILRVLRETHGVLAGPRGAAARLGLKRTTLQSRIQKLDITRKEYGG
ncbi:MAG: sigma 54-interacting transcriptional regulator [Acidobacteriia bacterium]|nr:sigma 54-interacting transcriptional regulator [Terriglobia bacterium]